MIPICESCCFRETRACKVTMPFIYPEVYVNTCYKSEDCFVVNSISRTIYGLNIMLNFFSWGDTDELVLGLYVVRVLWRLLLYEGKIKINTFFFLVDRM